METRVNHLLIGGAALLTIAALAAFGVWLAQVSFTEMQPYRIYFTESVAGLGTGAAVNLNGVEVGSVRDVRLDGDDPARVIVSVDIESRVPIHADATASLETQGFAGQQYVGISGGTADAPVLEAEGGTPAVIPSKPSALTQLMDAAPEIASRARDVVNRAAKLLDEAQRRNIRATIAAIEDVTRQLAERDQEIGQMVEDTAASARKLSRLIDTTGQTVHDADRLIQEDLQRLVSEGETAAASLAELTNEMEAFLAENRQPVRELTTEGFVEARHLINEARVLVDDLGQVAEMLRDNPDAFLFGDRANQFRPDSGR